MAEGIQGSLNNKQSYYQEYMTVGEENESYRSLGSIVTAKIVVVIEPNNVSAALDFIDQLEENEIMHPVVTLVGQKTKADRLYMEVRQVVLPSGLGVFSFPIKVLGTGLVQIMKVIYQLYRVVQQIPSRYRRLLSYPFRGLNRCL